MSIDFGKFKKKPKERQEIVEEEASDILNGELSDNLEKSDNSEISSEKKSDKVELSDKSDILNGELSDKSDILNGELSDNLEKSDNIKKDSNNPPNYNITSDQLRAIYVMITGKTNRNYTKKTLSNKIIEILTNGN